jgi:hypothetical protein
MDHDSRNGQNFPEREGATDARQARER